MVCCVDEIHAKVGNPSVALLPQPGHGYSHLRIALSQAETVAWRNHRANSNQSAGLEVCMIAYNTFSLALINKNRIKKKKQAWELLDFIVTWGRPSQVSIHASY